MLWILIFVLLVLFASECVYLVTRWTRQMPPSLQNAEVAEIEGQLNGVIKVFVLDSLAIEAFSLPVIGQQCLFIREQLWQRLDSTSRRQVLMWLSLASKSQPFWQRLMTGPTVSRLDRDLCVILKSGPDWASTLNLIYAERAQKSPTSWGALLTGLTVIGPGYFHSTTELGQRLKALAEQLTKLQK